MTAAEKNNKVLVVLAGAKFPMGPTEIAREIREAWCCYDVERWYATAQSAPITPILKRIGAVRHQGGKWTAPGL
jgi:hypothetical protein